MTPPRKGAIVVGSLAALAFLSAIGIAFAKSKQDGTSGGAGTGLLASPDTALEWMNAALGLPSNVQAATGASGRLYQIATWTAGGKEAVLATSLSPKTVYAVSRDTQDRVPSILADLVPDDIGRADVAALVHSF